MHHVLFLPFCALSTIIAYYHVPPHASTRSCMCHHVGYTQGRQSKRKGHGSSDQKEAVSQKVRSACTSEQPGPKRFSGTSSARVALLARVTSSPSPGSRPVSAGPMLAPTSSRKSGSGPGRTPTRPRRPPTT